MKEIVELEELARPLVDFLRDNYHPHVSVIVTDERVVVVEELISIPSAK